MLHNSQRLGKSNNSISLFFFNFKIQQTQIMENLLLFHLMIGPVVLGLSFLYKYYPNIQAVFWKQKIDNKEQTIWREAVRYSANAMIIGSFFTIIFQTISVLTMQPSSSIWASSIFLGSCLLGILPLTEIHLRKKYWYKD